MTKYLKCLLLALLPSLLAAQEIVYHDASQEKALIDSYLEAFTNNNTIGMYYDSKHLIDRLFNSYQASVYQQALQYLDQRSSSYPQAVVVLSDNIQSYWDSHYLHGYLLGNAGDYGKLKFFSILGMVVGGVGLWKNPFASMGTLKSLNVLLPLAGGGIGYGVSFFRKPSSFPPEPQEFLRVAVSNQPLSYAQKRNNYLYRLFSVGGAIASGDIVFKKIANTKEPASGGGGLARIESKTSYTTAASNQLGLTEQSAKKASSITTDYSLFKPALGSWQEFRGWLIPALGALLGMYAVQELSYRALRLAEIKKVEQELRGGVSTLDYQAKIGDVEAAINTVQSINSSVLKLVTLYEMKHLQMIVDFETEFGKKASEIASTDDDIRLKVEQLVVELTDKLPAKLTKVLKRNNYRYADVGTIKHLQQLTYQEIITDQQLSQQPEVTAIVDSFTEERGVIRGDIDLESEFSSYLKLLLDDRYADAQITIAGGKLQNNIEILFQVASVFRQISNNQQFAFLDHFQHKMEAKFHNMSVMYKNFVSMLERNTILRQKKFSRTDLQATIATYLDYHQADSKANTGNDSVVSTHGGQLTSARSFARFLAEFIGKSDTKTYNALVLELLATYKEHPYQRPAIAILLDDIEEVSELHDKYYDSLIMSGIEGGFVGAFSLMGARALAKLIHIVGEDLGRGETFPVIKKLLGAHPWKQMGAVFSIGAGAGVSYHFIKKMLTHKIYPKQALFAEQKLITFNLAQETCLLNLDINNQLITDRQTINNYNSDQIQKQREILAAFFNRVQQIEQQLKHLNTHAPQLQINHYLPANYHDNTTVAEPCQVTATTNGYAVSITPLQEDLNYSKSTLNRQQRMLDKVEENR